MKNAIKIGLLVMLTLTAYSQTSDSTKLIQVPKWKLDRLLQAYFYTLPTYDSLIKSYEKSIILADSTINSANKVILLRTEQRDLKAKEAELLKSQIAINDKIANQKIQQSYKKGVKSGIIITGIPAILFIILLL